MARTIITKELSVADVNQMQHRRNVIIIGILTVVFLGAFFFSLRDLSPAYAIGIVVLLGIFLISFINIRAGFILIILSFLLSPEVNLPFSKFRDFTLRAEDLVLVIIILAWLGRLAMGLQKHFIIPSPLNLPIFLIIIWNIICSWRAIISGMVDVPFCVFTNLKIIEFFLVYFLVANNLNDFKEVKFMFYALLITALIVGIYAYFQIPKTIAFTAHRLTAPFEGKPEPNTLGAYLVIMFGIALNFFIFAEPSFLRRLGALLVLLLPLPIIFTLSRTVYLAALFTVVFTAIVAKRKWLIMTLILFLLLTPYILPKQVFNRALYNFKDPRFFHLVDPAVAERIFTYQKAWDYIKTYPILGGGVTAGGGILDSQYSRVIIETGLIGLVLFLWLIIRLLKLGMRLFRSADHNWIKGVGAGFIGVVIGMLVHCFGNVSFCIVRIAEPFWALAAMVTFLLFYLNIERTLKKA